MRRLVMALVLAVAAVAAAVLGGRMLPRSDHTSRLFGASVRRVTVHVGSGKVSVTANRQTGARLSLVERFSVHRPDVTTHVAGGALRIDVECRKPRVFTCRTDVRLDVAPDIDVDATTGSGDVRVDDVAGRVAVRTGAGAIDVSGLTGDAQLHTAAGPISGLRLALSTARASTSAGSVTLGFVVAPDRVEATTAAGDVDLALPTDTYRISTSAPAGQAHVDVPVDPGSSRTISARSGAGSVRIRPAPPM